MDLILSQKFKNMNVKEKLSDKVNKIKISSKHFYSKLYNCNTN